MVGIGEQLVCHTQCLGILGVLGNIAFTIYFLILPISGTEVV